MATPDSTQSTAPGPSRRRPTASELLELARTLNRVPRKTLAAGARQVVEDPAGAVENIKKATAKTVSVAVSPGLYALQQIGGRMSAGIAGAVDPVLEYGRSGFQGEAPDVLSQSVRGFTKGVGSMEGPRGTPGATALPEVYKYHGFTEGAYRRLPGGEGRLTALMMLSGAQPKVLEGTAKALDWATGPEGAALGTDIVAGDRINEAANLIGKGVQKVGGSELASRAGDLARRTPYLGPAIGAFSQFGQVPRKVTDPRTGRVISRNAREDLRQMTRELHGERGELAAYWQEKVQGGREAIEEGAQTFGMLPTERSKYLEVIRENATPKGRFTYDRYVRDGQITAREAAWLTRVDEFLDLSVPAQRGMRGLRSGVLNEASDRAGRKAEEAIGRVTRLAEEGRQMLLAERRKWALDPEGNPIEVKGLATRMGINKKEGREALLRDLRKAISDADWATRAFSKVSRHKILPAEFDRKNLHNYTLEELLGFTEELTLPERKGLGMIAFDPALVPTRGDYKLMIRRHNLSGRLEARAFDKHGNMVWRLEDPGGSQAMGEGGLLERARRTLGMGTQFEIQPKATWRSYTVRGPRPTPIPRLQQIRKEIQDREQYFLNYLPRYGTDPVQRREALFRAGKKGGISTSIGGRRIAAPTTTQEEAREVIRSKFEEKSIRGVEPLQELTEALQTHIRTNASAVSKANFLHKVRENFGIEAVDPDEVRLLENAGWIALGKLKGATSGMTKEMLERYRHSYVPESVFNGVEALDRAISPKVREGFARLSHQILQNEKIYLTLPNPRFSIRNRMSEVLFSYARGNSNLSNWVDADRLVAGYYRNRKVPGFDMTGEQLIRYLQKEGVLSSDVGLSSEVMVRGKAVRDRIRDRFRDVRSAGDVIAEQSRPASALADEMKVDPRRGGGPLRKELMESAVEKLSAPVRFMSEVNQGGEQRARVAHWLWATRDKKMDRIAARKEVGTTMFDYASDFYTVQEQQLKEWIPFYSWFRRATPFAFRMIFERPGEFAKAGAVMNQVNAMNGVAPEEMEYLGKAYLNSVGIVLPDQKGQLPGTKRVMNVPYAIGDPSQFMQLTPELSENAPGGALTGVIRGAAGTLRPSAQLPLAFLYAQSPMGEKFTGETVKLPTVLLAMPDPVKERLGIQVVDGLPYGPSTLIPLVRYLQGGWGEAAGGAMSDNPRAQARLRAWLSGLSIDPEVPFEGNQRAKVFREIGQMEEKIHRLYQGAYRMQDAIIRQKMREQAEQSE